MSKSICISIYLSLYTSIYLHIYSDDECQTGLCAVEDMKGDAVDPISNNIFNVQKVISQQQQNHRISVIQVDISRPILGGDALP